MTGKIESTPPDGYDRDAAIMDVRCAAWFVGRMHPDSLLRSQCPRSKLGGRVVFEREQLLAWVASHRSHQLAVTTTEVAA